MESTAADYRIELEAYAGPLDLLLHLVKRHEVDLHDIPIAALTEQYLRHLAVIKTIDVDSAAEFLVVAAQLVEIKSQMLGASVAQRADDEDDLERDAATGDDPTSVIDPRSELVQQLLAYKRYKDASLALERRADEWDRRAAVKAKAGEADADAGADAEQRELDLEDVHVMDLCAAFGRILETVGHVGDHQVTYDDTPISLHAEDIRDRLERDGSMSLQAIFQGRSRGEMIGLFLAVLELVRQRAVKVEQGAAGGEIALALRPAEDRAPGQEDESVEVEDPPAEAGSAE